MRPTVMRSMKEPDDKVCSHVEMLENRMEKKEALSRKAEFGVCWNCSRFRFTRTKYGREIAQCMHYDEPSKGLSKEDPIIECSEHIDKFHPTLNMMWAMATLIDAKKPAQAGFVLEEEEEGDHEEDS